MEKNGYSPWWWHRHNENVKHQTGRGGETVYGTILKHGRAFFYRYGFQFFKIEWSWRVQGELSFVVTLDCDDDPGIQLHLSLFGLPGLWMTFGTPRRWFQRWMISDRVFGVRLGYIGDIAWVSIAHTQWAEDCGMTSYYRAEKPRRYTNAQLWPGWLLKLRWPPVTRWLFGHVDFKIEDLRQKAVSYDFDGRKYHALLKWQRYTWRRERLPWPHRTRYSTYIEHTDPPQFAGKGENSYDCDDDGIYGMSSQEKTEAGVVGDYIKAVLKNRERYGKPRDRATA